MSKNHLILYASLIWLLASCHKDSSKQALPTGSVSIELPGNVDTLVQSLSVKGDSTLVLGLTARLSGKTAASNHWVTFAVDTTKIIYYREQYGNAILLPTSSYFFYKTMVEISAGASISDSAQINIVQESKLNPDTTYVLPIVVQAVDGDPDEAPSNQVLYMVFRTGDPKYLPKTNWTIAAYSSQSSTTRAPSYLIDKDDQVTYWASAVAQQMPQWFEIGFNSTVTFRTVDYFYPPSLAYPKNGGYPTSIHIETSLDGVNWTDNGTYTGNLVNNEQSLNTGTVHAAYLRFTVLSAVIYASTYNLVIISGIELEP